MRLILMALLSAGLAGCAENIAYNPMQVANQQELLLNESGLKALQIGMTTEQVHKLMGTGLLIGYQFQSPDYKPLTILNPYKTEVLKGSDYVIEYYMKAIRQPDGVVSDDELMPLIFKKGIFIGRGWPLVESVRRNPSA